MKIKIVNKSEHPLPSYETLLSAGMDLRANINGDYSTLANKPAIAISPGQRALVPTGLYIALPAGYEAQIRPRSGLAYKHGVTVLNSPGTVDADYRGEVKVLLINKSDELYIVEHGERIAQMVIAKHEQAEWEEVEDLEDTERGKGGFGSTGK